MDFVCAFAAFVEVNTFCACKCLLVCSGMLFKELIFTYKVDVRWPELVSFFFVKSRIVYFFVNVSCALACMPACVHACKRAFLCACMRVRARGCVFFLSMCFGASISILFSLVRAAVRACVQICLLVDLCSCLILYGNDRFCGLRSRDVRVLGKELRILLQFVLV